MNRSISLIIVILLITMESNSQGLSKYFLKDNIPLEFTDISPVGTGGFIATANYTDSIMTPFYYPLLVRLSDSGDIIWVKLLTFPAAGFSGNVSRVIEKPGLGYIISGSTCTFSMLENLFISQFDYNGNLVWFKEYETNEFFLSWFKHRLTLLDSGGFLFTGSNNGETSYYLMLDSIGDAMWGKSYGFDTTCFFIHPGNAIELSNGDLLSIGQYNSYFLFKSNALGDTKWYKRLNNVLLFNEKLFKTLDDKVILCGSQQDSSNAVFNIALAKLDTSGYVLWSVKYTPTMMSSLKFDDIIQLEDSSFILSTTHTSNFLYDKFPIVLLHVDKNGILLTSSKIDTTAFSGFYNSYTLKNLGNDTILLAGGPYLFKYHLNDGINCNEFSYSFNNSNFPIAYSTGNFTVINFISPTLSSCNVTNIIVDDGNYCDLVGFNDDLISNRILLYPNPINDIIFIENSIHCDKYQMYNINGKIVYEILHPGNRSEINVSIFPSGVYFIKFFLQNSSEVKIIILY